MTGKCILESWNTLVMPIFSYSVKGGNSFLLWLFFFGWLEQPATFISLITNRKMLISRDIIVVIKKNPLMGHSSFPPCLFYSSGEEVMACRWPVLPLLCQPQLIIKTFSFLEERKQSWLFPICLFSSKALIRGGEVGGGKADADGAAGGNWFTEESVLLLLVGMRNR